MTAAVISRPGPSARLGAAAGGVPRGPEATRALAASDAPDYLGIRAFPPGSTVAVSRLELLYRGL